MRCERCNEPIVINAEAGLYWHYKETGRRKKPLSYYGFVVLHNGCVSNRAYDKWLSCDEVRKTPFSKLVKELRRYATFDERELLRAIRGEE